MEKCARCGKNEEEVMLFDGIYVNEPVKICERCAILSNILIIKKPTSEQLKASERPFGVRDRLSRMAGIKQEYKKQGISLQEEIKRAEEAQELAKPSDLVFKLVDNFHWVIKIARRRRGFSSKQLADAISESQSAIEMLEKAIIPRDAMNLITKLEQFLKISLIKKDSLEIMREKEKRAIEEARKRAIRDMEKKSDEIIFDIEKERKERIQHFRDTMTIREGGEENPLAIPEKIIEKLRKEEADEMVKFAVEHEKPEIRKFEEVDGKPLGVLNFRKDKITGMTISDLRRMQEQIDKDSPDFSEESKKEIAEEQLAGFGKEDTEKIKRKVFDFDKMKERKKDSKVVPSIYDLMKKREEKDKSMIGKDIEVIEDNSEDTEKKNRENQEFEM
jgi:ribosome-binding protein aMBF1 (putative translation factor)